MGLGWNAVIQGDSVALWLRVGGRISQIGALLSEELILTAADYGLSSFIYQGAGVEWSDSAGLSNSLATRGRSNFSDRSIIKRATIFLRSAFMLTVWS